MLLRDLDTDWAITLMNETEMGVAILLSQWLAIRCGEPEFWAFVQARSFSPDITSAEMCNAEVKLYLNIISKKEVDNNKNAEYRFSEMIRNPYTKWLAGER